MTELEQELVAVSGVSRAHVDVSQGDGVTLHVELDDDANRDSVAAAVDVVLRRHGLRSRAREDHADVGVEAATPPIDNVATPEEVGEDPVEASAPGSVPVGTPRDGVAEVVIGHSPGKVSVLVRSMNGREATREVVNRGVAVDQAIAGAVGELLGHRLVPHVLEVSRGEFASRNAVTVVLDLGEVLVIGTSFEETGSPLGLARAVWDALAGY